MLLASGGGMFGEHGFVHFMVHEASIFLYLIFITSFLGVGVIIARAYALWVKYSLDYDGVTNQIAGMVETGAFNQALQVCNGGHHPMTEIMKAALTRANRPEKEIRRGVERVAMDEITKVKGSLHLLPHISNIATLLGLLGTIRGLITSFSGLSSGDAAARTEMLSRGVSEAFSATFFGILVATITIAGYLALHGKQSKLLHKIEHGVATVVDVLLSKQAEMRAADGGAPARGMMR